MTAPGPRADSIYFLMFPGWPTEFRSNRWHYASRWARHLPVTLVQPHATLSQMGAQVEDEPRIPGCRILHVAANPHEGGSFARGLLQSAQLLEDMAQQGYRRPILWAYDPGYVVPYALVPAVVRIYHATENYFQFPDLTGGFLDRLAAMTGMSDMVLAVSGGVAVSYQGHTHSPVEVVTNGCDRNFYAATTPDAELLNVGAGFERVAIYAGNINDRLDYALLKRLAEAQPGILFAFFGRVSRLAAEDTALWTGLCDLHNVRYFGAVAAERLPGLYSAAHLGIAAYKPRADLLDNLFPLKIFEMLSNGLPLVSSPFASLRDKACAALRLPVTDDEFLAAAASLDRRLLTAADLAAAERLCRDEDYEKKFATVHTAVISRLAAEPSAPIAGQLGLPNADAVRHWLTDVMLVARLAEPTARQLLRRLGIVLRRQAIEIVARYVPRGFRAMIKKWVLPGRIMP